MCHPYKMQRWGEGVAPDYRLQPLGPAVCPPPSEHAGETTTVGHEGCVNCLEWSEDGSLLASASDDCSVRVWSAARQLSCVQRYHSG